MTHSGDHISDDDLSALIDNQLDPEEARNVRTHLDACSVCDQRLAELRAVVGLLKALPSVEPPRDFQVTRPRLVVDPPNVIRLQRWYVATRVSAAALAAAFVFLSAGTLYIDSRPAPSRGGEAGQPPAPEAMRAPAAPASAPKVAAPAGAAVRLGSPTPQSGDASDQIAAATSVRPLPTPVPTPKSFASPPVDGSAQVDTAAPLRAAAIIAGALAVLTLLTAVLVRHRLRTASLQSLRE